MVLAVQNQFHEIAHRPVHLHVRIGQLADVVPDVEAQAVAHARKVHGHRVEHPLVVGRDAEERRVQVAAQRILQGHGVALFLKCGSRRAAPVDSGAAAEDRLSGSALLGIDQDQPRRGRHLLAYLRVRIDVEAHHGQCGEHHLPVGIPVPALHQHPVLPAGTVTIDENYRVGHLEIFQPHLLPVSHELAVQQDARTRLHVHRHFPLSAGKDCAVQGTAHRVRHTGNPVYLQKEIRLRRLGADRNGAEKGKHRAKKPSTQFLHTLT